VSDLFASLTSAARALEAQRYGLDVTGQNIANVNTPGYTRRVVDLGEVPPESSRSAGRGVEILGIRSQRDRLLERRLEREISGAHRDAALGDALGIVESALGSTGRSIDVRLTEFFDSFARLADDPSSAVARRDVLQQAQSLASAFRETSDRLAQARTDTDRQIVSTVDQINSLADRIATLNRSLGSTTDNGAKLSLQDEQAKLVRQLAELTDIGVLERADGGVDIDIAEGRALVVGDSSFALTTTANASGQHSIAAAGVDITNKLTGGKIGGLVQARDVNIPAYQARLDDQAFALADAVNTIHSAGYDLNGNTGQAFFTFTVAPVGTAGAARALTVDPSIVADVSKIAAAQAALPGDNRTARALADVRDARVLDGGTATLTEGWSQLVYQVGRDVQTARSEQSVRDEVVAQTEALRDQVSGVSLDEEAMQLMKFQRAYEASARFFTVIDETLDILFGTLGR
jgi:flagellar hook-associated protein 1 FlgK